MRGAQLRQWQVDQGVAADAGDGEAWFGLHLADGGEGEALERLLEGVARLGRDLDEQTRAGFGEET